MKIIWVAAALLLASVLFWWQPNWDREFTQLFYNNATHHFWLAQYPVLEVLRQIMVSLLVLLVGTLFLLLLLKIIKPDWVLCIKAKAVVYLLLCFVLAPALLVNVVLKDHWGRPRPHQVQDFGGPAIYQPVWKVSHQCNHNCSFVCGDCAFAFTLFAFLPLVRRKVLLFTSVSLFGLGLSFLRVSAGGHFISDALLSAFIVYLVTAAIHALLYKTRWLSEARTEEFFSHLHQKLMRMCS